jgi:hypothetical protein
MKFICRVPISKVDEMYTYNKLMDHIAKDDTEQLYKFRRITAHHDCAHAIKIIKHHDIMSE